MVMDAGLKGLHLAWASGAECAALDSQGAIERAPALKFSQVRSWIKQELQQQLDRGPQRLIWVKGHSKIFGNEADRVAGNTGWIGKSIAKPEIATQTGIRQPSPNHGA